jgi:hypothetical protein
MKSSCHLRTSRGCLLPRTQNCTVPTEVQVKVMLRQSVSRPVCLGIEPYLGLMTRYLLLFYSCGLLSVGRPCDGRMGVFYMLLALATVAFLELESLRLAGSRSRYSTPPPLCRIALYSLCTGPTENSLFIVEFRLPIDCIWMIVARTCRKEVM